MIKGNSLISALSIVLLLPDPGYGQALFINIGSGEKPLSSLQVTDLFQDSYGFIWVGTAHGLNRFDAYEFVQYINLPDDTSSISSNYISPHSIVEDQVGNLWVGTLRGGVNCFNRMTERFVHFRASDARPGTISMDKIFALEADGQNGLWVATAGRGINHYDPGSRSFQVLNADEQHPNLLMGSTVTSCLEMVQDRWLWIGTNKGACRFDPQTGSFEYFPFVEGLERSLSDSFVTTIFEDSGSNIWVGTACGLNRWDAQKGVFLKYYFDDRLSRKQSSYNYVLEIEEDNDGSLWIGTTKGLLRFNPTDGKVEQFLHEDGNPHSIQPGPVNAILKDRDGNIWVGTNNGISILNTTGRVLRHSSFDPVWRVFDDITQSEGINAVAVWQDALWLATQTGLYYFPYGGNAVQLFSSGNFSALFIDKETKIVYAGTIGDGFYMLDADRRRYIRHVPRSKIGETTDPYSVKGNRISSFVKDRQGFVWIAADGCLNRYDPATGRIRKFQKEEKNHPNPSSDTNIHLLIDHHDNLWIASFGGLSKLLKSELDKPFESADLNFEHYLHQPGNHGTISSSVVFCLLESADGYIWVGTDAGLNRFNPDKNSWKWFFKTDGLPGNEPVALVEDKNGDIWVGDAHDGLGKYDNVSGRFLHFSNYDGLLTERFRPNAGLLTPQGLVIMGGRTGLVGFDPNELRRGKKILPPFYCTNFKIFNSFATIGKGKNQLALPAYESDVIELDYDQHVLTFQFAALNFINPQKQVYRFKLSPFQDEWHYNGSSREVTFTNLDPGFYQLYAESSDNGYDWIGTSLALHVYPPWYSTWWAYLFYAVTAGGILFGVRRFELRRQIIKAEAGRLKVLDQLKTRLYTNITHEFRTPLTVILGETAQLESQVGKNQKGGLLAIRRQGQHLLNLVNQMLELAKVEAGAEELHLIQGNVILFIKYLLESFRSVADKSGIELRFECNNLIFEGEGAEFWMDYDPDKLQKIVSNLLSNALKFTPQGGTVVLRIETVAAGRPLMRFEVANTGQGIPLEKIPFVFDRFYQVDETGTRKAEGTGIGLTLVKELVHLLGGQIMVDSSPGEGATFIVTLPVTRKADQQHFAADTLFSNLPKRQSEPENTAVSTAHLLASRLKSDNPRLLLVEDNPDVSGYLTALLAPIYYLYKADNGREGIEMAFRFVPDIIVSDVMMPEFDGFELCRILKADERTSHIPIMLLTAKVDHDSMMKGLTHGADVYLPKPFDQQELMLHLEKLIDLRRLLQARFANLNHFKKIGKTEIMDQEQRFLQKAVLIIAARMADEEFAMPQLCKALNMSRSNLFRKIKALTGKSATEFIRSLRLGKAKSLLETTDLTVAEVGYRVGFSSPNYFSRVFQEEFGFAPSEIRSR